MVKLYHSLDSAREEIRKRWANNELKKAVEKELNCNFWGEFKQTPRSLLWRPILSPDNGLIFFLQCSQYAGVTPLAFEFLGDMYLSTNEEKRGLGQIRVKLENENRATFNLFDLHKWNKKLFGNIVIRGLPSLHLIDFHHELLAKSGYSIEILDKTNWVKNIGRPKDFYYPYLLHFIAHGILFEVFYQENCMSEISFTNEIIMPAIEKIRENYGLSPIVVRLYPENQTEIEDFDWWCYPPHVNDYLVRYAREHSFTFKPGKF
jgi:hypothetical protein